MRAKRHRLRTADDDVASRYRDVELSGKREEAKVALEKLHQTKEVSLQEAKVALEKLHQTKEELVTVTMVKARMQAQIAAYEQRLRELDNGISGSIARFVLRAGRRWRAWTSRS